MTDFNDYLQVRPGAEGLPTIVDMVSELGIFGAIIGTKEKILYNRQVGHMLRTKGSSANEGKHQFTILFMVHY